jgi:hypothetical protein
MLFNLRNPIELKRFQEKCAALAEKAEKLQQYNPKGELCVVELSEKHQQRSASQNNYCHVILAYFASEYGVTADEAKVDYFKRLVNPDIFVRSRVNKKGKEVKFLRSTRDLSKDEMSLAISRFRDWSSAEAEIYIPSGEEYEYLTYCKQQIDRSKEYL